MKSTTLTSKDLVAVMCFFASGLVGLVYEICWIRKSTLVFGATTFAVSTVVAVFFAGLALGSYIFGRYSQKTLRPLKLYALLEIGVGVSALFNPALFSWADNLYGLFYPSVMQSFAFLSFIRFIFIAFLIMPPTILMGGTLPLFCRQYVVNENKITLSVGLLYGLNTLGAAIGCIACGFYLVPNIGINTTIWLGGVVNILIGLAVMRMKIMAIPSNEIDTKSEVARGKDIPSSMPSFMPVPSAGHDITTISALFFLSGFVALGNEILWTRYLSLIIHNTVYTYTLTLAITLGGIVLGSMLISGFTDRSYRRVLIFGAVHVLNGVSVLAVLMLPAEWWKGVIDTGEFSTHLWIFMLVLLFPAILSGISFPLAIRLVVERPSLAGIGVGKMTAINTFGGIAGSLAIGFIALPRIGLQKSLLVTTGMSLFIGFVAWFLLERTLRSLVRNAIVAFSLLIWLAIPFVTGTRLPADFLADRDELVDFREGLGSDMTVIKKKGNVLMLEIDRMWQGSNLKNRQIMAAHVPMLLHKDPKDILVIGLGVGQTASRFLLYDVAQLDCVDIEGELSGLVREHFESSWMDDKRFRFIVEDGRNYLTHTNRKYDVISIEVGQIFRPGLASFYTTDFYRHARNRLNDNGIVSQFVPIRRLAPNELRAVIRSFLEVFPESVLWYNTSEFLLIGTSADGLKFSSERLRMLSSDDAINKDLRFAYWGGRAYWLNQQEVFMASFLCGPDSLAKLTAQASVYRDDLPVLEYITAKMQTSNAKSILDLIRPYIDPSSLALVEKLDHESLFKIQSIRERNLRNIMAEYFFASYQRHHNISLLHQAIEWNPDNVHLNVMLANALTKSGETQKAIPYYNRALRINPENQNVHYNLGVVLAEQGMTTDAIYHYSEALRIDSDFVEAHYSLGNALAAQGRFGEAIYHYSEALRNRPDYADARDNLKIMLAGTEKFDETIAKIQKVLKLKPGNAELYNTLGNLYQKVGELDKAVEQYRKALSIQPRFVEALNNLASVYTIRMEYDNALSVFKKMISLWPDKDRTYYNVACIYAMQNKTEESIEWLKKAIEKGYNNWDLIKTDKDLENIRGSSRYRDMVRGH